MKPIKLRLWISAMAVATAGLASSALAERVIHIDKKTLQMYVVENADTLAAFPVCAGENLGQKRRSGDHRTPEGTFKIITMERSSGWGREKGSDGVWRSSYGPWFMRLNCPQSRHIGIHGTSDPSSIGTRASEGCIRMHNEDLLKLKDMVKIGTKVIVYPD